ncbi:PrpF domain-containing protein [Marinomonas sp. 2405UD68-3]|uniref:PrpF domain-containing protein n=1 Tax=Marinomonas sp. 2405UD68-3 TaxID=3391835 RepID=UPI0039C9FB8A
MEVRTKIIRGGSSKGVFIDASEVPPAGVERDAMILRLFGTPDRRQIDGLGGADKLTSKVAIIGLSQRTDCDVSYLFGQVGTEHPTVDWQSNCGNISAGVALYAAHQGVGSTYGDHRKIRIEQCNTGRVIEATVPVTNGVPNNTGAFSIGGVPGQGPRIDLDFKDFSGSCLNRGLFPSGERLSHMSIPGVGSLDVTVVDMANLHIFVHARDLQILPSDSIDTLQANRILLEKLDCIRATVALELGFFSAKELEVSLSRNMNPLVHIMDDAYSYQSDNGQPIRKDAIDLLVRSYSRGQFSKAYPGTGAVGTAVAACIEHTLPYRYRISQRGDPQRVSLGHPGGTMSIDVTVHEVDGGYQISRAQLGRTARLLMSGTAYLD